MHLLSGAILFALYQPKYSNNLNLDDCIRVF